MQPIHKVLIILAVALLALTGCQTKIKIQKEYVYPTLPEFTIEAPTNPTLEIVPEGSSYEDAIRILSSNLVKVIGVNNQHVLYEQTFIEFYNNVKNNINQSQENTLP